MNSIKPEIEDLLANREFVDWVEAPTLESNIYWQKWLEINSYKQDVVDQARNMLQSIRFHKMEIEEDRASKVLENIIAEAYSHRNSNKTDVIHIKQGSLRKLFFLRVAAAILLLLTSIAYYFVYLNEAVEEVKAPELITKSNPMGRKSTILLPDGSMVQLNSDSKISYQSNFNSSRVLQLSGEAFFSVKKDTIPFEVHTPNLITTVLGTKFNVKAFEGAQKESISLVEGKVQVKNHRNTTIGLSILVEGESLVYDELENMTYKHKLSENEFAWKEGYLSFNRTELSEFVHMIRRWYGVEVTILGKPKTKWEITGKYKAHSLDLLLESIKFSEGIDYKINKKNVELNLKQ